jgi:dihydrofolate reductase
MGEIEKQGTRLSLIVAMDRHGLIGSENGLPWHLPADLKRFRKLTSGKPIVMGRKTYDTLGRPLPDRLNLVVTRQEGFDAPGCVVCHSLDEALTMAEAALPDMGADETVVIGGAEVFRQALPRVARLYLTIVEGVFAGSTFFPSVPEFRGNVVKEESLPADTKNPHAQRFMVVERDAEGCFTTSAFPPADG